jgi:hypothetical protein
MFWPLDQLIKMHQRTANLAAMVKRLAGWLHKYKGNQALHERFFEG